jgi:hypothetical protein
VGQVEMNIDKECIRKGMKGTIPTFGKKEMNQNTDKTMRE